VVKGLSRPRNATGPGSLGATILVKLKVDEWNRVQDAVREEHPVLDAYIEQRIWGKRWNRSITIVLNAKEEQVTRAALEKIRENQEES
jgi:hypothetical protein